MPLGDGVIGDSPDQELVRRFKAGEEQAFSELVRRHQGRLYGLAMRMVRESDDAADICQDVFVKAYQSLGSFREDSSVFTWLYRITLNYSVNHLRRKRLRESIAVNMGFGWLMDREVGPERGLARDDVGAAVAQAVAKLPPRQRAVFVLRQYEGLSHEEIAQTLSRSVGAVKANYFHAVKRLQRELEGYQRYIAEGQL